MPSAWDGRRLQRAHQGHRAEARAFVAQFQGCVFAVLAHAFPGERALVEDLAQETFMRALGAAHRFDPQGTGTLRRWVATIASRVALDEVRRQGRRPRVEPIDEATAPEADRAEVAMQLEQAVQQLSPQSRLVVALRLVGGLTEEEAAAALGVQAGTVKSRLSRARAMLKNLLGATA